MIIKGGFNFVNINNSKILRSKGWQESKISKLFSEVQQPEFEEWSKIFDFSTELSILPVSISHVSIRFIITPSLTIQNFSLLKTNFHFLLLPWLFIDILTDSVLPPT